MAEGEVNQLKHVIEHVHGCTAALIQSVHIHEEVGNDVVWEGVVHVFELTGHPTAIRAYGWSSVVGANKKRRLHVVLHTSHASSPRKAVRTVLASERRPILSSLQQSA